MNVAAMAISISSSTILQPTKPIRILQPQSKNRITTSFSLQTPTTPISSEALKLAADFDPTIPLHQALTPPSSWYTHPSFLDLELDRVFYKTWQLVGNTEQVKESQDFFTGKLGNVEYVVCRDNDGKIHAFHNVCRHHASILSYGSGKKSCFVCPYHGWTYKLEGTLQKATRMSGIQDFNYNEHGLIPIKIAIWGPFILLNLDKDSDTELVENEWLGNNCSKMLTTNGIDSSLNFISRREYIIECNWKVFCDNYLDGGYHVPYAHKSLASNLELQSYSTTIYDKVSIQKCEGGDQNQDSDRIGTKAFYAFIYPNFMINRYGPWMDINLVLPLGHKKCKVVFDYFLEPNLKNDEDFINRSLKDSDKVQAEDVMLCEGVQRGLESPAYYTGRYAPTVEHAMHHFHCLLHENLTKG